MMLADEATSAAHVAGGRWGTATLDDLFRAGAAAHPALPLLLDAGDRGSWCPGAAPRRTRAEVDGRVEALAAFFSSLGLRPDAVVAFLMPNIADAYVTALACWRAGLVVAPLPLFAGRAAQIEAVAAVGARALVTVGSMEGLALGEEAREIAFANFSVRFLFGWGDDLPDGVIDLDGALMVPDALGAAPAFAAGGNPADRAALVAWAVTADGGSLPVPFSHNHLIAMARAYAADIGLASGAKILSPFEPAGLPAFVAGLATALVLDGTLELHHASSLAALRDHARQSRPDRVLLPAPIAKRIRATSIGDGADLRPGITSVSHDPGEGDLWSAGGLALMPDGGRLAVQPVVVAVGTGESALDGLAAGALLPDRLFATVPARNGAAPNGTRRLVAQVAGERVGTVAGPVDLSTVDALYRGFPGALHAAAFVAERHDGLVRFGAAIVPRPGTEVGAATFDAYLGASGAPLHLRPVAIRIVDAIRRSPDGRLEPDEIAA